MQDYAFCPKCRHQLETRGEGRYCAACGLELFDNVAAVAGSLPVNSRGQVLLARRGREPFKGDYGMIGGFMQAGETPEQTALREAGEETGLRLRIIDLLGMYPDRYGADGAHTLNIIYITHVISGTPKAADDAVALEWLDIANLPNRALTGGFHNTQAALHDLQAWYRVHHGDIKEGSA